MRILSHLAEDRQLLQLPLQIWSPQKTGQGPQSARQVLHVSPTALSHALLPQNGAGQMPQSMGQMLQSSPNLPSQNPSPLVVLCGFVDICAEDSCERRLALLF